MFCSLDLGSTLAVSTTPSVIQCSGGELWLVLMSELHVTQCSTTIALYFHKNFIIPSLPKPVLVVLFMNLNPVANSWRSMNSFTSSTVSRKTLALMAAAKVVKTPTPKHSHHYKSFWNINIYKLYLKETSQRIVMIISSNFKLTDFQNTFTLGKPVTFTTKQYTT